jgi:phosphatidate cytidylyltransferase
VKDLASRVAVAAVGIPAVLALLYVGGWALGLFLAAFAALGAGEVYRFAETHGTRPMSWLGMPAAALVAVTPVLHTDYADAAPVMMAVLLVLGGLTLTLALWSRGPRGHPLAVVSMTVFGAAYSGLPLSFVLLLHALPMRMGWGPVQPSPWIGAMVVALPLAATWVGDAAAYFLGTAWGRAKLFPAVSPHKSWVGAWAGVAGAAAAGVGWYFVVRDALPGLPLDGWATFAGVGALLGVGAILGDLAESLLKREAGVKDSGRLLRGHGGVLDRLDALTYTFPMAYLVLRLAEALS